jgi:hypothetical protein
MHLSFIKRFYLFMDFPCPSVLLRPSKHSHILNSTQPPPPIILIQKQSCDAMLCYVSNIRNVCDVKYVTFRIFETYAMLNIRNVCDAILRFEHSNDSCDTMFCFQYSKHNIASQSLYPFHDSSESRDYI